MRTKNKTLLLTLVFLAQLSICDIQILISKEETLTKPINEVFPNPIIRPDQKSPLPYSTNNPSVIYSEWNEVGFGLFPEDISDCTNPFILKDNPDSELQLAALCGHRIKILKFEKTQESLEHASVEEVGVKYPVRPDVLAQSGEEFVVLGYKIGSDTTVEFGVISKNQETIKETFELEDKKVSGAEIGIAIFYPESSLKQPNDDKNIISIVFHKYLGEAEFQNSILRTIDPKKPDKTKTLELSLATNFVVDNPLVRDIEIYKNEMRVTFSKIENNEYRLGICKIGPNSQEGQSYIKILEKCSEIKIELTLLKKPILKLRRIKDRTLLAVGTETQTDQLVYVCEVEGLAAKNCTPLKRKTQKDTKLEKIGYNPEGGFYATYINRDKKLCRIDHSITQIPAQDSLQAETIADLRSVGFIRTNSGKMIFLRQKSFSVHSEVPQKGNLIVSSDFAYETETRVTITEVDSKDNEQLFVSILSKSGQGQQIHPPNSISVFPDQTYLMPFDRKNFFGNALNIEFEVKGAPAENLDIYDFEDFNLVLKGKEPNQQILDIKLFDNSHGAVVLQEAQALRVKEISCSEKQKEKTCEIKKELLTEFSSGVVETFDVQNVKNPRYPGFVIKIAVRNRDDLLIKAVEFIYLNTVTSKTAHFKLEKEEWLEYASDLYFYEQSKSRSILLVSLAKRKRIEGFYVKNMEFNTIDRRDRVVIDKTSPGIESEATFCPKQINESSSNDSVIEVLSGCPGDPRVYKWILNNSEEPKFLESVPLYAPWIDTSTEMTSFCAFDKELSGFVLEKHKIFGKSVGGSFSHFNYNLSDFGLAIARKMICFSDQNAFVVVGNSEDDTKKYVAIVYGDKSDLATSRIHSVTEVPVDARVISTPATGNDAINLWIDKGEKYELKRAYLRGPFVHLKIPTGGEKPEIKIKIKSANQKDISILNYDKIEMDEFDKEKKFIDVKSSGLKKGINLFKENFEFEGHVWRAKLSSKDNKLKFIERVREVEEINVEKVEKDEETVVKGMTSSGSKLLVLLTGKDFNTRTLFFKNIIEEKSAKPFTIEAFCKKFDGAFIEGAAVIALGCYEQNEYKLRLVLLPEAEEEDENDLQLQVGEIDGIQVVEKTKNSVVVAIWNKRSNKVTFEEFEFSKGSTGGWGIKPLPSKYETVFEGKIFIKFS